MLATLLRTGSQPTTISDDFQRADGSMGVTSVGFLPWMALAGTWSIASHTAHTTAAATSNPFVVVETGLANVTVQATVSSSGGDCLYFRVQDATNWLRLRVHEYTTSYQYYNQSGWDPQAYTQTCQDQGSYSPGQVYYSNYYQSSGIPQTEMVITSTPCSGAAGTGGAGWTANWHSQTVTGPFTGYNYNDQVILEKCVAGTVTALATYATSPTTLKAVCSGSTVTAYANTTQIWTGTVTNFQAATKHGVGLGAPSDVYGSAISAFSVSLVS